MSVSLEWKSANPGEFLKMDEKFKKTGKFSVKFGRKLAISQILGQLGTFLQISQRGCCHQGHQHNPALIILFSLKYAVESLFEANYTLLHTIPSS